MPTSKITTVFYSSSWGVCFFFFAEMLVSTKFWTYYILQILCCSCFYLIVFKKYNSVGLIKQQALRLWLKCFDIWFNNLWKIVLIITACGELSGTDRNSPTGRTCSDHIRHDATEIMNNCANIVAAGQRCAVGYIINKGCLQWQLGLSLSFKPVQFSVFMHCVSSVQVCLCSLRFSSVHYLRLKSDYANLPRAAVSTVPTHKTAKLAFLTLLRLHYWPVLHFRRTWRLCFVMITGWRVDSWVTDHTSLFTKNADELHDVVKVIWGANFLRAFFVCFSLFDTVIKFCKSFVIRNE